MPSRVTILLTCYNHLAHLKVALESVWAQTYGDFEVLALDDGSSDGTREWLADQTDPRLKLTFNEENLGTYATLNVGIEQAKGEFLAILNDDDVWAPDKLARQLALMDSFDRIALVHTGGRFIDGDGAVMADPAPMGFPFPRTSSGDVLAELLEANKVCTSAALIRRSALDKVGPFDPSFYGMGDWHLWLRIAREFEVGYVDEPLTDYRVHAGNASRASESMLKDDLRIREWIASWIDQRAEFKILAARNYAALAELRFRLGDSSGARQAAGEAVRRNPTRWQNYARWALTLKPGGRK